ncbi:MAG: sugar phosphate isomerase/epimerase family protein [Planctomycetota bacterium]|nr:sugar phosphate isomerase/epimerase family protein [Planctomycetota bacterium]
MKFAICNETFQDWPLGRGFEFAAECGYTGIEIAPFTIANIVTDITAAQREEVRREVDKAGLTVVGLHWLLAKTEGFYLTSPDAEIRKKTADYFAALAQCCADVGGKVMVLGSPQQRNLLPGVTLEEATGYAAEVVESLVPVLEKMGVTLALEPLGPTEGDFLNTAAEGVALAERIGSPHVRLHLDVKAMSSEAMPAADVIRQNGDILAHFHANDPNLQGPGFGDEDFVPIFEALGQIDYQGWVSVEVFDYTPGVERLAKESIDYMNECLEKVRKEGSG